MVITLGTYAAAYNASLVAGRYAPVASPVEVIAHWTLGATATGSTAGAIIGITQWLVLRRSINKITPWVLANVIGAAIGLALGGILIAVLPWSSLGAAIEHLSTITGIARTFDTSGTLLLIGGVAGIFIIGGIITGLMWVRLIARSLLRPPSHTTPAASPPT